MEGQLTLSELNVKVKEALQNTFAEQLWIVAEIAEMKVNRSGHCYLELVDKDSTTNEINARARATIWSWQFRFIQPYFETSTGQILTVGLRVLIAVTVEFHEIYGYSLNIKDIDPAYTLGDLARKRLEVIRKLTDDGVIGMNKEISIAEIPSRIAVISSPTAAGFEDFINQLINNQSGYKFYTKLFPATMQGNEAAQSIIAALDEIYEYEAYFDLVVLIRGGGSQLDLACFDDYNLAYHMTQFPLPILTGIGHEKDDTIADMVANTRLKTPTAVAEFLIGKFDHVAHEVNGYQSQIFDVLTYKLSEEKHRIERCARVLKPILNAKIERALGLLNQFNIEIKSTYKSNIGQKQYQLLELSKELKTDSLLFITSKKRELSSLVSKTSMKSTYELNSDLQLLLSSERRLKMGARQLLDKQVYLLRNLDKNRQLVDPLVILNRGFSITLKDGKVIRDSAEVSIGDEIETVLAKGKVMSIAKRNKRLEY